MVFEPAGCSKNEKSSCPKTIFHRFVGLSTATSSAKLLRSGCLHLGYHAVEMTLHRRIVRSLSSIDDSSLRSICRQAAQVRLKSATDFVSILRPEHLQSFWYSASKYNFALIGTFISLLWATTTDKDEANLYRKSLEKHRWMLRLSSKSADFSRARNRYACGLDRRTHQSYTEHSGCGSHPKSTLG